MFAIFSAVDVDVDVDVVKNSHRWDRAVTGFAPIEFAVSTFPWTGHERQSL